MISCVRVDLFRDNMAAISKKEEEKNEKLIRALLKLPENRKCVNCASVVCLLSQLLEAFRANFDLVSGLRVGPWLTDKVFQGLPNFLEGEPSSSYRLST